MHHHLLLFFNKIQVLLGMVAHTYDLSTQEAETGGSPVQHQPEDQFKACMNYKVKPCLEKILIKNKMHFKKRKHL